jgi:hypothetical protein
MARGWPDKLKRRHLAKIRQTHRLEALSVMALDFANSGFLSHLRVTGQFTPFQLQTASVGTSALSMLRCSRCNVCAGAWGFTWFFCA